MLSLVYELAAKQYNKELTSLEIDGRHVAIFETLKHLGPQVQAHLSTIVRVDKATMVSLLNDLEARELVERRPHPSDARANQIYITEGGLKLLAEATQVSQRVTDSFFQALSEDEQQTFHALLLRVAKSNISPDFFFR